MVTFPLGRAEVMGLEPPKEPVAPPSIVPPGPVGPNVGGILTPPGPIPLIQQAGDTKKAGVILKHSREELHGRLLHKTHLKGLPPCSPV